MSSKRNPILSTSSIRSSRRSTVSFHDDAEQSRDSASPSKPTTWSVSRKNSSVIFQQCIEDQQAQEVYEERVRISSAKDPSIGHRTPTAIRQQRRETARKAWGLIRQKIQEVALSRRDISFNWKFLGQHISNMAAKEKAREELYEKYLYGDMDWWAQGLVNYPHHFFTHKRKLRTRELQGTHR